MAVYTKRTNVVNYEKLKTKSEWSTNTNGQNCLKE